MNYAYVYAENQNELSVGIAAGNGIMENVSGMHGPVTGNLGTNIKGLVLDDNSMNTIYSINIDYNKYSFNKFYWRHFIKNNYSIYKWKGR